MIDSTSSWTVGFVMLNLLAISLENACVNVTGCNGCGTTAIDCTAAGLTEFPTFPADDIVLVENLKLSVNHLTTISVLDLQPFTQLQELDLSINDIVHIEERSFITNLSMISLAENPLHCDCTLRWLLDYFDYLPPESDVDAGTCETPSLLARTSFVTLNNSQLICECVPECGMNSSCDFSTGTCICNPGYTGQNCSQECFPGSYGLNCSEECTCEAGSCDHVTGVCTCLPGYHGANCTHDCSEAPDCTILGRENCSLNTPENSCGTCHELLSSYVDTEWIGSGNSLCIDYTVSGTVQQTSTTPTMQQNPSMTLSHGVLISSTHSPVSYVTVVSEKSVENQSHITTSQLIIILTCAGFVLILLTVSLMILSIGIIYWKHTYRQKRRISPLYSDKETSQVLESIANTSTV